MTFSTIYWSKKDCVANGFRAWLGVTKSHAISQTQSNFTVALFRWQCMQID